MRLAGKNTRDISVELLRIFACFMVVCVHFKLPDFIEDTPSLGRIFISSLCADGVGVFWLITGFFVFRNRSFKNLFLRRSKQY